MNLATLLSRKKKQKATKVVLSGVKCGREDRTFGYEIKKRLFAEIVFIKKKGHNCLNKITDLEHYNPSYNMLLDFFT